MCTTNTTSIDIHPPIMSTCNHINIHACFKVPCTNTNAMHLHNLQLHNLYICHSPLCFKKPCTTINIFHFTFTSLNIPLCHSFTQQFFRDPDMDKSFFTTSCTFRTSTSTFTVLSNMLTPSFDALSIATHLRFISATLDSSSKKEHTTGISSTMHSFKFNNSPCTSSIVNVFSILLYITPFLEENIDTTLLHLTNDNSFFSPAYVFNSTSDFLKTFSTSSFITSLFNTISLTFDNRSNFSSHNSFTSFKSNTSVILFRSLSTKTS